MSKPNTTATMPQDIDSNPPYSDDADDDSLVNMDNQFADSQLADSDSNSLLADSDSDSLLADSDSDSLLADSDSDSLLADSQLVDSDSDSLLADSHLADSYSLADSHLADSYSLADSHLADSYSLADSHLADSYSLADMDNNQFADSLPADSDSDSLADILVPFFFQDVPVCPQFNADLASTVAVKRTHSSSYDEDPRLSASKLARTRLNSMESLSDLTLSDSNEEVCQSNSNLDFQDLEPVEVSFDEPGDAELAVSSVDSEPGDAADERAARDELATEYPREEDGELLSGSSQLENVSVHHDAVRTSPENGTSQARIQPYEAPFYYTLRCELRRALMHVEVEPTRGDGLDRIEIYARGSARLSTGVQKPNSPHNHRIVNDGILHDIIVWIAGSGSAPQIPMQEEQHRVFSEKKSQFHEVQSPGDSSTRYVFIDLTLQRKNYALLQGDAGTTKFQLVVKVFYKDGSVDTKQAQEIPVFSKPSRGLSSIDDAPIRGAIAAFHQALNHARSSASGNDNLESHYLGSGGMGFADSAIRRR